MTNLTASVATIQIGAVSLQGLMDSKGNFFVAVPQLADIGLVPPNRSAKQLESLLGNSFQSQFLKFKTSINPKAVNAVPLSFFEGLIFELALKGNEKAIAISRTLHGLSWHQLFCDAFGLKFEKEDRQAWLKARMEGKAARRTLTDAIADWYAKFPKGTTRPPHVMYAQVTNAIYQKLWGVDAIGLEQILKCDRNKAREYLDAKSLKYLEHAEFNVMEVIDNREIKPIDAVALTQIWTKPMPQSRS